MRHMVDIIEKPVQAQVFLPMTVMLRIPLVLCGEIAKAKRAAICFQATQCLVIHVLEHTSIWKSDTSVLEVNTVN